MCLKTSMVKQLTAAKMTLKLPEIQQLKEDICADWVNALDLKIVEVQEQSARFRWRTTNNILRVVIDADSIVSGQATMAVADTASFMTICALNGKFRNCATIDMHTNFMRPLFEGDVDVLVTAIAMGRKTVTTRIEFSMANSDKLASSATGVFMYLD